jgi:HNH endonuclease
MELSQEFLQKVFHYEDGCLYRKKQIGEQILIGKRAGRINHAYRAVSVKGKEYMEHRIIFMFHHGYFPEEVDHIDGNKTNNKIENLRPATHAENLRNQKLKSSNTSGFKNVGWAKREERWRVRLTVSGKDKHIGYFKDRELADLVALEACNLYHKNFSSYKGALSGKQ